MTSRGMGSVRRRPLGRRITLWCGVQILGMKVPPFVRFGTDRNGGDEGGSTNTGDKDGLGVFHDVRRRVNKVRVCMCKVSDQLGVEVWKAQNQLRNWGIELWGGCTSFILSGPEI